MLQIYSVVKFIKTNQVDIVPFTWVNSKLTRCQWPPGKDVNKLVKSCAALDKKWPYYDIKVLGTYEKYEKARQKLLRAAATSDLESSCNEERRGREKPSPKKKPVLPKSAPKTAKDIVRAGTSSGNSSTAPTKGQKRNQELMMTSSSSKRTRRDTPSPVSDLDAFSVSPSPSYSRHPLLNISKPDLKSTSTPKPPYHRNNNSENSSDSRTFELVRGQEKIKVELKEQRKLLERILHILESRHDDDDNTNNFQLPIQSMSELNELESSLKTDKNVKKWLKREVKSVGGSHHVEGTRLTLHKLMSDEVASTFSWAGKTGKKSFKALQLCPIMINILGQMYNKSDKVIMRTVAERLKHVKVGSARDEAGDGRVSSDDDDEEDQSGNNNSRNSDSDRDNEIDDDAEDDRESDIDAGRDSEDDSDKEQENERD